MFIVLCREDSCGPIYQNRFATYEEAKTSFDRWKETYFFCKLCIIIEENN